MLVFSSGFLEKKNVLPKVQTFRTSVYAYSFLIQTSPMTALFCLDFNGNLMILVPRFEVFMKNPGFQNQNQKQDRKTLRNNITSRKYLWWFLPRLANFMIVKWNKMNNLLLMSASRLSWSSIHFHFDEQADECI